MYKILTAAALLFACLVGGAIAGEPEMIVEEVTIVRPVKEQPVTESDLVGRISDNVRSSQHYDRHDPQVVFDDWVDHDKYAGNWADQ